MSSTPRPSASAAPARGDGPSAPTPEVLSHQYGCGPVPLTGAENALYDRHIVFDTVIDPAQATPRAQYEAFARSVRDVLAQRWLRTIETYREKSAKRVYYMSMEFLIGRTLSNSVANMQLAQLSREAAARKMLDWNEVIEQEPDAGLGNGGLGRLAACFLDSMATMEIPAIGYGLRYEYGMFRQTIENGWQNEQADHWLQRPDPWEVQRPHEQVEVKLGCGFALVDGHLQIAPGRPSTLLGIPYDRPVVGYGGRTVNTLRLWAAAVRNEFDFHEFSSGDFVGALANALSAESLTRVLYPDDSTLRGRCLRFIQEYFLVACSLADIVRRFQREKNDWHLLPQRAAIQLNDTHPSLAVPELLRILLDDARLDWDTAWKLTRETLAYTNHTLLPEALERWPVQWFEMFLPRHLELIYEINRRLLDDVRRRFPGDEGKVQRISLIEEGPERRVRMANMAIVGSHSTNGVAALHSELLRKQTVHDLAEMFPERFNNKTNGVTPRRWVMLANPELSAVLDQTAGPSWVTDLSQLTRLRPLAGDAGVVESIRLAKHGAKTRFAEWLRSSADLRVDPESIFDCQVKRIHEYKRQFLNALRIVVLYNRLRANPSADFAPTTYFFAGKAAPAYHLAKVIIKFLNNLAATIDADPAVKGRMKVVFLPEYCVTLAERLIPAADVSNQISTAGYEASGTSNMKFMMNGALTMGTRDGATIEMAAAAGEENFLLFGLTAQEVQDSRGWYSPRWHYDHDPEIRQAIDMIVGDYFSPSEHGVFEPLREMLFDHGDRYMHLADLRSYLDADARLRALRAKPREWFRTVLLNIASSGEFSSDRTIAQYARDIWKVTPCPVQ